MSSSGVAHARTARKRADRNASSAKAGACGRLDETDCARCGSISVFLDEVDHAGTFLELEQIVTGDDDPVGIQEDLDAFARSLGVSLHRTTSTYDSLIHAALETGHPTPVG